MTRESFYFIAHSSLACPRYRGEGEPKTWAWTMFEKRPNGSPGQLPLTHSGFGYVPPGNPLPDDVPAELAALLPDLNADPTGFEQGIIGIFPTTAASNTSCPVMGVDRPIDTTAAYGLSGVGGGSVQIVCPEAAHKHYPRLAALLERHGMLPPPPAPPEPEAKRRRRECAAAAKAGAERRKEREIAESERCQKLNDVDEADAIESIVELLPRIRAAGDEATDREIARDLVGALILVFPPRDYRNAEPRPRRKRK